MSNVIVIGGGASGLMSAIFAKKNGHQVTIIERNEKLGYKLRESVLKKIPYTLILGQKEVDNNEISFRRYGSEETETVSLEKFISKCFIFVAFSPVINFSTMKFANNSDFFSQLYKTLKLRETFNANYIKQVFEKPIQTLSKNKMFLESKLSLLEMLKNLDFSLFSSFSCRVSVILARIVR